MIAAHDIDRYAHYDNLPARLKTHTKEAESRGLHSAFSLLGRDFRLLGLDRQNLLAAVETAGRADSV
jgi:hypothetical protein